MTRNDTQTEVLVLHTTMSYREHWCQNGQREKHVFGIHTNEQQWYLKFIGATETLAERFTKSPIALKKCIAGFVETLTRSIIRFVPSLAESPAELLTFFILSIELPPQHRSAN